MKAEIVNMSILPPWERNGEAQVECTFILHNTGSKTTALVGFPAERLPSDVGDSDTTLYNFELYIDGEEKEFIVKPGKEIQGFDEYKRWYVWEMEFDQGAVKIVKNKYRVTISKSSTGSYWFAYILKTGATWKGKIGKALINVEFKYPLIDSQKATEKESSLMSWLSSEQEAFLEKHPEIVQSINSNGSVLYEGKGLKIIPAGYKLTNNKISWCLSNFEPEKDIEVEFDRFKWFVQCIEEISPQSSEIFREFQPPVYE